MAFCPYCGNEVEEYDFICGKCGKTITTGNDSQQSSYNSQSSYTGGQYSDNSYSGNTGGAYTNNSYAENTGNSYAGNTYADNSYTGNTYTDNSYTGNTYTDNSYTGNTSSTYTDNNYTGNTGSTYNSPYPEYGNVQQPGYPGNNYQPPKKKGSLLGVGIGAGIVLVIAIIIAFIAPLFTQDVNKEYGKGVQQAAEVLWEYDYIKFDETSVYDYVGMLKDMTEMSESEVVEALQEEADNQKEELEDEYGKNYKITYKIQTATKLTGSDKSEAIDDAFDDMDTNLSYYGIDVKDYVNENSFREIVRVKASTSIKGSKKSDTKTIWVDLVRVTGEKDWKLLEIYEK